MGRVGRVFICLFHLSFILSIYCSLILPLVIEFGCQGPPVMYYVPLVPLLLMTRIVDFNPFGASYILGEITTIIIGSSLIMAIYLTLQIMGLETLIAIGTYILRTIMGFTGFYVVIGRAFIMMLLSIVFYKLTPR